MAVVGLVVVGVAVLVELLGLFTNRERERERERERIIVFDYDVINKRFFLPTNFDLKPY